MKINMSKDKYIDYNHTQIIKAVAIILMFIHHFFGFKNWYVQNINFNNSIKFITELAIASQVCVAVFAFVTGYCYCFNKNKTYKYSLKKITDILCCYWIVCFIMTTVSIIMGHMKFNLISILKEFLLLDCKVMCFCWYVRFYILTMLILPLFNKVFNKNKGIAILMVIFIVIGLVTLMFGNLLRNATTVFEIIQEFIKYFPVIIVGYIFAYFSIFEKINNNIIKKHINNNLLEIIISISIICISLLVKMIWTNYFWNKKIFFLFNIDIICVSLFIFSLINIIKKIKIRKINDIFLKLGKYSMLMWFIHCIFFNVSNKIFQPILYFCNSYIVVLIWGIFICYIISKIINIPIKKIINIKNKLIRI